MTISTIQKADSGKTNETSNMKVGVLIPFLMFPKCGIEMGRPWVGPRVKKKPFVGSFLQKLQKIF